ncbi:MAG: hypothetical protein A6F72_04165 [Cycloclasticus sp. symbiont of Poecilosclerida sp. N]|nr:MAG: hypothetical protein A6F72_04165 [Cycloclasticus sp. symbiont of Poecilosclerida sp. N]
MMHYNKIHANLLGYTVSTGTARARAEGPDNNSEYPLIKREFILSAYSLLQIEVRDNCISSVDYEPWKQHLSLLFEKQGKKCKETYSEIKKGVFTVKPESVFTLVQNRCSL